LVLVTLQAQQVDKVLAGLQRSSAKWISEGCVLFEVDALFGFGFGRRRGGDDVHVRLDGLDEALGHQGDDVGLVEELERGVLHAAEHGLNALHRGAAAVDHGLDDVWR